MSMLFNHECDTGLSLPEDLSWVLCCTTRIDKAAMHVLPEGILW